MLIKDKCFQTLGHSGQPICMPTKSNYELCEKKEKILGEGEPPNQWSVHNASGYSGEVARKRG